MSGARARGAKAAAAALALIVAAAVAVTACRPSSSATLPTGASAVGVVADEGFLSFDAASGRATAWTSYGSAQEKAGVAAVRDVAWAAAKRRLVALGSDPSSPDLVAIEIAPDGTATPAMRGRAADFAAQHVGEGESGGCKLLREGDAIGCWGRTQSQPGTGAYDRLHLLLRALGDASPPRSAEAKDAVTELTTVAFAPDRSRVFYTAGCDGARACVYAIAPDGTGRSELAKIAGEPCVMAVAADGAHLAIAATEPGSLDRCTDVWLADAGGARRLVQVKPTEARSRAGIAALAFSPDGRSLAALSDARTGGCSGSQGVSSCEEQLVVLDVGGGAWRAPTSRTTTGGRIVAFTP